MAALELLALGLSDRRRRAVLVASGVVGLGGMFVLYETAEHGGDLVYQYAGGVGVRSGDPNDLSRLLLAGLYHNAVLDRSEGRPVDAARLIEEMSRRFPDDSAASDRIANPRPSKRRGCVGGTGSVHGPGGEQAIAFAGGITHGGRVAVDRTYGLGANDAGGPAARLPV